jgi:hypothetical protein
MGISDDAGSLNPYAKVDKTSLLELVDRLAAAYDDQYSIDAKVGKGVKGGKIPLVSVIDFIMSGRPGSYVYLLVKPVREPTERLIVPVLLEHPSKFEEQ